MDAAVGGAGGPGGAGGVQCGGIAHPGKTKRRCRSATTGGLNGIRLCRTIKFELALTEKGKAELVDAPGADGRGVAGVYLLRARCVNSREVSERSSLGLKFGERIEGIVVVKIVVHGGFLTVIKSMIDLDLKLIAPVSLLWNCDYRGCASPCAGYVSKQAQCHRIKTSCGNLVIHSGVEVGENTGRS